MSSERESPRDQDDQDRLLKAVMDSAHYAMVLSCGNDILYANQAAVSTLGYELEELPTMEIAFERFYPSRETRREMREKWLEILRGVDPVPEMVSLVRCKDGSEKILSFYPPVLLPRGRLLTTFVDVTERELAREALTQRDVLLDALARNAKDFVVFRVRVDHSLPHHGEVDFVTDSARAVLGIDDPEEFDSWFATVHPEELRLIEEATAHSALTGEKFDQEMRILHPKQGERWVHTIANATADEGGRASYFTGTIVDTTEAHRAQAEREELEARVQRARELESLGQLAGGVAHDFNNLLMTIMGCASIARARLDDRAELDRLLRAVEDQVQRGAELTQQLLGYARQAPAEMHPLELRRAVEETTEAFARTRRNVALRLRLSDQPLVVRGDRGQLDRTLLNLLINAAEAMDDRGEIEVSTGEASNPALLGALEVDADEAAWLEVRDRGEGMDEATMGRIFDPFFSTKPRGQGTGLGLSAAWGIVRAHGGAIDVTSEPGEGSAFRVYLPRCNDPIAPAAAIAASPHRGEGTVLLVDDEPTVLEVVEELLWRLGYQVITASSGLEALERYRDQGDAIDVVLLDVVMPEMNGGEVWQRLRKLDPSVRVLFSSGYGEKALDSTPGARQVPLIRKPYELSLLADKLAEVLSAPPR